MEALPAVAGVEMDMNKGCVTVKLKPSGAVTAEQLADTVRRAGYTAKRVQLDDLP